MSESPKPQPTPTAIRGIDHLNIVVRDLDASVHFYCDLLGFRLDKRVRIQGEWMEKIVGLKGVDAEVAFVVAPAGEPRIELLQYISPSGAVMPANSTPNTRGLRHIALRVDEIEAMSAHLRSHGIHFFGEPVTVPGSVVQHDAGQKSLVYFLDPDGVILELAQYD